MKIQDIKAAVLRIEGTNCEEEMKRGFEKLGVNAELVHLKQFTDSAISKSRKRKLSNYQILMFPGGFSSGDYVRAGAIWSARINSKLKKELDDFVKEGKAIGGVCNGFQVLTTLGLLPGTVRAALVTNESSKFECRYVHLKHFRNCAFTDKVQNNSIVEFPIGHGEGRFTFSPGKEKQDLKTLDENNQIVFKYVTPENELAKGKYPWNPNGATQDIAGICNPEGNVFGLMPHPERVLERFEHANWTRSSEKPDSEGDGINIFKSVIEYTRRKF